MATVYGSMRHSSNGRRKKTNYWKKSKGYTGQFVALQTSGPVRRDVPDYPSADIMASPTRSHTELSREERNAISSQYTIAPAYNKGAYQVIPKENIKHIGR